MRIRHIITLLSVAALLCSTAYADKVTPRLKSQMRMERRSDVVDGSLRHKPLRDRVAVRIKVVGEEVYDLIEELGIDIERRFGTTAYLRVSAAELPLLEDIAGVILVDAPSTMQVYNNVARAATGVDLCQEGYDSDGDIIPFTGKGVVIGVVDVGVDPTHIAFMDRDLSKGTRIRKYVYMKENEDEELEVDAYTTPEDIASAPMNYLSDGHGTHVAGTAAGAWMSNEYYGVAPDAELVITSTEVLSDEAILEGIEAARTYAQNAGKPLTVNLSLGNLLGSHDGHNYISDYMSDLPTDGFIVNFAAGNDAHECCSLSRDFSTNSTPLRTYLCARGSNLWVPETFIVQGWSDDSKPFDLKMIVIDRNTEQPVYTSAPLNMGARQEELAEGVMLLSNVSDYPSELPELENYFDGYCVLYAETDAVSNRFNILFFGEVNVQPETHQYFLGFEVTSEHGASVMLLPELQVCAFAGKFSGFTYGNGNDSISDLCTSPYVVSVGSWNARDSWTAIDGTVNPLTSFYGVAGDVARYSSYGPKRGPEGGEMLPHVLAPGTYTISAYNHLYVEETGYGEVASEVEAGGRKNQWGVYSGTSMAVPHATGIIALWLEAKPDLTRDDVVNIIRATSTQDSYTQARPERCGAGKIDAYAGLKYIQTHLGGILTTVDQPLLPLKLMVRQFGGGRMECVLPAGVDGGVASIYRMDGSLCHAQKFSGNVTMLEASLTPGIYLLHLDTRAGRAVQKISVR